MRIALVSDAWAPQVNGVVRTLQTTVATLRARGHAVETITPDAFRTIACPTYPEIRLALGCGRAVADRLEQAAPDAVHIATEGSLGWAARRWCLSAGRPFTTSFHTHFPDYVAMRTGLPAKWFWPILGRFHRPAHAIMVATETLATELAGHGLTQTRRWSRGVDLSLFSPSRSSHPMLAGRRGPIQLYVGRVACEKNIEAFLASSVPGTKVIVGDGPARTALERRFPQALFLGALHGAELASVYAGADVFVFPSRTDTFGLVMIEALASGVPVAAFPVHGPLDVIGGLGRGPGGRAGAPIGALRDDLDAAIRAALTADRGACVAEGRRYAWEACTDQFLAALAGPVERRFAHAA
ncbi:glycosyltransferase family 1 protein [Sphingomonas sp. BIUV-7]|uniref:Glycosyltransferase family 1 protein n=1 Tax=Sphingomonas natans TaxID=3063330 RepID=A0ABT8YEJ6_9SPHN|nr:glycosyltransferase family 1 protein [Sphingomonas sp. BIUV-7]MDO6416782.1 glycosyltransferase family 1 protein [Sphingomonas sp. BIUV-7]